MLAVLGRILAICLGLITACYSPPQPDCGFACHRSGECPSDYFCAPDGVCHRNGTPASTVCAVDARIDSPRPIDAPPPDADTTPPQVFMTDPVDGASNVPTSQVVTIQFNEPVSGVSSTTFYLRENSTPIAGVVMTIDAFRYSFTPTSALPASATITVYIDAGIFDSSNNPFPGATFNFTTAP